MSCILLQNTTFHDDFSTSKARLSTEPPAPQRSAPSTLDGVLPVAGSHHIEEERTGLNTCTPIRANHEEASTQLAKSQDTVEKQCELLLRERKNHAQALHHAYVYMELIRSKLGNVKR